MCGATPRASPRPTARPPSGTSPAGGRPSSATRSRSFLWGGGEVLKYWPANHDDDQYARMRPTSVPTLVISGTNDFATPPRFATRELLPYLRHGHQVLVGELGHTTDFWHHDQKAGARLVDTFLDTGKVVGYPHRAMDFHPPVRQTTLAKRVAGLLLGLAALAVASLAWLLRRRAAVRARGERAAALGLRRADRPRRLGAGRAGDDDPRPGLPARRRRARRAGRGPAGRPGRRPDLAHAAPRRPVGRAAGRVAERHGRPAGDRHRGDRRRRGREPGRDRLRAAGGATPARIG